MLIKLEASLYLNGAARGRNLNFFWVILVSEITLLQNTRPETEFDPNYGEWIKLKIIKYREVGLLNFFVSLVPQESSKYLVWSKAKSNGRLGPKQALADCFLNKAGQDCLRVENAANFSKTMKLDFQYNN